MLRRRHNKVASSCERSLYCFNLLDFKLQGFCVTCKAKWHIGITLSGICQSVSPFFGSHTFLGNHTLLVFCRGHMHSLECCQSGSSYLRFSISQIFLFASSHGLTQPKYTWPCQHHPMLSRIFRCRIHNYDVNLAMLNWWKKDQRQHSNAFWHVCLCKFKQE